MKGVEAISKLMMALAVLVVGAVFFSLVMGYSGNSLKLAESLEQGTSGHFIAASINALSTTDAGIVQRHFIKPRDIEVSGADVTIDGDVEVEGYLIAKVGNDNKVDLEGVADLCITKDFGQSVQVSKC